MAGQPLHDNELTGDIPTELGNLSNLHLSGNQLSLNLGESIDRGYTDGAGQPLQPGRRCHSGGTS